MPPRKKLVRKDVIRLARQKLWTDIGKALDSYEKHVYGDLALGSKRTSKETPAEIEDATGALWLLGQHSDLLDETLARTGDITSVEEIEKILPPEPLKRRGTRTVRRTPVNDHIRGITDGKPSALAQRMVPSAREIAKRVDDDNAFDRGGSARAERDEVNPPNAYGLGSSEEKVLILIAQSAGGLTPAQLAIQITLKKRTIQNILTELKSRHYIIKDENHGKFRATEEGRVAIAGRYADLKKGAILEKLSETERKVLFAIGSKKKGITLSALSVMVPGVKKRTKQNILTALKTRELIEKIEDRFALTEYAREELKGKLERVARAVDPRVMTWIYSVLAFFCAVKATHGQSAAREADR